MTTFKKDQDKIVIEIPYWSDRYNPYMDKVVGKHPTLIGLVIKKSEHWEEYGFGYVIDMDYKGKDDQFTDIMFQYTDGGREEFQELCGKLEVDCIELDENYSYSRNISLNMV